ncbi:MAG: hypothetical protein DWG76_01250 [Chloroflexi bacterium]|nr:hypothetical protein [Chloroflexota bacterium]
MNERIEMDAGADLKITVERVGGSLQVKGWERDIWRVERPHDKDSFIQNKNQLSIRAHGDCILRVPSESQLTVNRVGGNANVFDLEGEVAIESVGGSVNLRRVGPSRIEHIGGHLDARDVDGDLTVVTVSGNATLREIEGNINAPNIGASLNLREAGAVVTAGAGGNANLRNDLMPGARHSIRCGGNAYCQLESPANAEVSLESGSGNILVITNEGSQDLQSHKHTLQFGNGDARLAIVAGGHIDFRSREGGDDFDFDLDLDLGENFENLVEGITDQVSSQMEAQLESLNEQLESLGEQFKATGNRAMHQAQRRVEAAQGRIEHRLQGKRHKHSGRSFAAAFGLGNAPEPVSDEERMKVLEMVQEKKISVEEAESLLATLEGREPPKRAEKDSSAKESES